MEREYPFIEHIFYLIYKFYVDNTVSIFPGKRFM